MSGISNLTSRFSGSATEPSIIEAIAKASLIEAKNKEARLLNFFEQPFGNNAPPFHLAAIYWDYLKEFKTEGKKRKDNATESILHELDQSLFARDLLRAEFLPPHITREILPSASRHLPPEQQSIENLFCTFSIHDMDEDSPDHNRETLIEFGNDHISDIAKFNDAEEILLRRQIDFLANVSDAITFGRKARMSDGSVIKETTHNNNLPTYMRAMQEVWPAITAKGMDRLGGLITRFSRVPVKSMKMHKNMSYLDETRRLFMHAQPLENSARRFPELAEYFEIINMNIRIALVTMDEIIQHHPNLNPKHFKFRGTRDPETAEVDIRYQLPIAMKASPWIRKDVCPMTCLVEGITAETERYPELMPILEQILKQVEPHFTNLESHLSKPMPSPLSS